MFAFQNPNYQKFVEAKRIIKSLRNRFKMGKNLLKKHKSNIFFTLFFSLLVQSWPELKLYSDQIWGLDPWVWNQCIRVGMWEEIWVISNICFVQRSPLQKPNQNRNKTVIQCIYFIWNSGHMSNSLSKFFVALLKKLYAIEYKGKPALGLMSHVIKLYPIIMLWILIDTTNLKI